MPGATEDVRNGPPTKDARRAFAGHGTNSVAGPLLEHFRHRLQERGTRVSDVLEAESSDGSGEQLDKEDDTLSPPGFRPNDSIPLRRTSPVASMQDFTGEGMQ